MNKWFSSACCVAFLLLQAGFLRSEQIEKKTAHVTASKKSKANTAKNANSGLLYRWVDAEGCTHITDKKPPVGSTGIKTYRRSSKKHPIMAQSVNPENEVQARIIQEASGSRKAVNRRQGRLYIYGDSAGETVVSHLSPDRINTPGLTLKHTGVSHTRMGMAKVGTKPVCR